MNNYKIIEHLYEKNGITDYKLRTTEDLLNIHGIDFKAVNGYGGLDDVNRSMYENFIVNFFNGLGLESRMTLIPKGIYYVEDTNYVVPEEDYLLVVAGIVESIDRDGVRTILRTWSDKDYKDVEQTKGESKRYLRIEYEHDGRAEWLHVMKEDEWY